MSTILCNICADDKVHTDFIQCTSCSFESCSDCTKKYILGKNDLANCMNCSEYFKIEFLIDNFGKTFVWGPSKNKNYKKHMEDIFFDQQKSMIPATKIKMQDIEEKKKLEQEISEMTLKLNDLKFRLRVLKEELNVPKEKIDSSESSGILCHCPSISCKGYISSRTKKCKTCNIEVCSICEEIKKDQNVHVCNKDIIESIKNTRKCPNCMSRIQKSQGCHQMYCILCDTFFDWTTGRKTSDLRFLHNPEHSELVAKGLVSAKGTGAYNTNTFENQYHYKYPHSMREIYRITIEMRSDYQRTIAKNSVNKKMEEYRIAFINKEITDDAFKQNIQRLYKKSSKESEANAVRIKFCDFVKKTLEDLFPMVKELKFNTNYKLEYLYDVPWNSLEFNKAYRSIEKEFKKCEEELENIGKKFNNDKPYFLARVKNFKLMIYTENKEIYV